MTPPSPTIPERMATVETEVRHVREDIAELNTDLKSMHASNDVRLKAIEDVLAQAKGGWKTLMAAGTIGSAVTAAVAGGVAKLKGWI